MIHFVGMFFPQVSHRHSRCVCSFIHLVFRINCVWTNQTWCLLKTNNFYHFGCGMATLIQVTSTKRKWRDREESTGRWPGDVMSKKVIFNPAEVSFFWRKFVFRDFRMQSCLALRFLVTLRPPLHKIFAFLSDRGWPAWGRLGRQTSSRTKTSARLKVAFVDMTYPKGWTGSLPLYPLIFSWQHILLSVLPTVEKVAREDNSRPWEKWNVKNTQQSHNDVYYTKISSLTNSVT